MSCLLAGTFVLYCFLLPLILSMAPKISSRISIFSHLFNCDRRLRLGNVGVLYISVAHLPSSAVKDVD